MKYWLCALFLFASSHASATCFAVYGAATKDTRESVLNYFQLTQYLVPVPGADTIELCRQHVRVSYWLEPLSKTQTETPDTSGSAQVVTAIQDSTLAITTALACLCFFVGLNSWETSAK